METIEPIPITSASLRNLADYFHSDSLYQTLVDDGVYTIVETTPNLYCK
jgi:hypothetical protein